MLGMTAFTVFHEIFLHALPDLRAANFGAAKTTEKQDHDIILIPADESNAFHQSVKAVLPGIPVELRQYFVDAYVDDVRLEKERNTGVDAVAAERWYQLLNTHSNDLTSAFWSTRTS